MISGRIITHKETTRYRANNNRNFYGTYPGIDYEDESYSYDWKAKDTALQKLINDAISEGFIIGAIVRRKNGIQGTGRITEIHRLYTTAYNYNRNRLEPFKVAWENKIHATMGNAYDYNPEDLELVSKAPLSIIIENSTGETENENLSNLHQPS